MSMKMWTGESGREGSVSCGRVERGVKNLDFLVYIINGWLHIPQNGMKLCSKMKKLMCLH